MNFHCGAVLLLSTFSSEGKSFVQSTNTDLCVSFVSVVVTGATDGIGKSYAEEVRLVNSTTNKGLTHVGVTDQL